MKITSIIVFLVFGIFQLPGQSAYQKAEELTNQQSFETSSSLLLRYIDENPQRKYDVARAWWLHSYNLLKGGQPEQASQANTNSLELRTALRSSDAASNYLRQAEIMLVLSKPDLALDNALQGMQFMIEDASLFAQLNMMCAKALTAMEHYDEAQAYLQTALDIIAIELGKHHPAYSHFAYNAGFLSLGGKAFNNARTFFSRTFIYSDDLILKTKAFILAISNYRLGS